MVLSFHPPRKAGAPEGARGSGDLALRRPRGLTAAVRPVRSLTGDTVPCTAAVFPGYSVTTLSKKDPSKSEAMESTF